MPRITPISWRRLERVFLKAGLVFVRQEGTSHRFYSKPGMERPVVIPTYKEIDVEIIKANMRTAGMSRDEYFKLLGEI